MNKVEEKMILSNEHLLQIIGEVASLFHRAISIPTTIAVTDREHFTHYYESAESSVHNDLVGKPFPGKGFIPVVLNTGTIQGGLVPKEVYGEAIKTTVVPLKNSEDDIIGTLTVALSLKNQNALQEVTNNLSASAEQLSATSEEISASAIKLYDNVSEVLLQTQQIIKLIAQTNSILDFINNVASNSRLLGLNAAIEAARAGDVGRGFTVVAAEIQKMGENSANSVNETKTLISAINDKIHQLLIKTEVLSDISQTQAAATQEIAASVQDLATNIQVVQKVSEII